eukprot:COSAG02_NODE_3615_length_6474_cov_4.439059_1_plen_2022_part_00
MQSAALLELAGSEAIGEAQHVKLQLLFGSLFKLEACLRQASPDDASHTGRALAPLHLLCLVRNSRSPGQRECALLSVTCVLSQNCTFYISSAQPVDEHTSVVREGEGESLPTVLQLAGSTRSFSLVGDRRKFANAVRDAAKGSAGLAPTGWLGHLLQVPLPPEEGVPDVDPTPEECTTPKAAVAASLQLLSEPRRTGWDVGVAQSLGAATDITAAWVGGWHRAIVSDSGEDHILYSVNVRRGAELHRVLRRYTDFAHLHRTLVSAIPPALVALFAPLPRKTFFALNDTAKADRARALERYLRSLIIVLQRDSLAASDPEPPVPSVGGGQHPLALKHPSDLSSTDVAQLHAVADARNTCLHSGWLDYRSDDSEWAPRWITLVQQASLSHSPDKADQGICWLLVHARDGDDDQPQIVVPLTSFVVKERTKKNKFSIIVCAAATTEWVHKFRAPEDAAEPSKVIMEWVEVIDHKVTPTLQCFLQNTQRRQQEVHGSTPAPGATTEQSDDIVAAAPTPQSGWVDRERGRGSSFFEDKAWDRSWAVLHTEPGLASDEDGVDATKDSVTSGGAPVPGKATPSPTHWLLFFHRGSGTVSDELSEPSVGRRLVLELAVPLIRDCFTVAPPKKARTGREHVLILRCHARHSANGWKHVLSFSSAADLQAWHKALQTLSSQLALASAPFAFGSPQLDLRSCSAAMLESSCKKAGWLHWLGPVTGKSTSRNSEDAGPSWAAQWTLLVTFDTSTWLVAFESDSGDAAPTAFVRVAPEALVDVVAPPADCVVNGRCVRLTGSYSPHEASPNAAVAGDEPAWQHVSKSWCYLLIADDELATSSWYEAVQRIRTTVHRRTTEKMIQTLRPSVDSQHHTSAGNPGGTQTFDDARKQGLAILLAFLDIVGNQPTRWNAQDTRASFAARASMTTGLARMTASAADAEGFSTMSAFSSSQRRLPVGSMRSTIPMELGDMSSPSSSQMIGASGRPRNRTMIQSYIQSRTDVLFSGFLWKQGVSVKSWKKRYFILREDMLMYQKTEQGGAVSGKRGGVVPLGEAGTWSAEAAIDALSVSRRNVDGGSEYATAAARSGTSSTNGSSASIGGREHCFAIFTLGRTLMLSADTAEQMDAWLSALNKLRSRAGDEALRRGVQAHFSPGAAASASTIGDADVVGRLTSLLRVVQYEVDSLCELDTLKEKLLEAVEAMQPAACLGAGDSSAGSVSADKATDLGEMEIDPDEVTMKDLLAEGFFGKVYRGELHGLDVAIKKLKTDSLKTADPQEAAELVAELRAEVDVLTHLRHPNVVLIMGASTKNPANLFIVTEFLDRGNLYNVIHNPKLTDDQTLGMIEQVVLAINFLHGRTPKIIHRDIKPLNILVDSAHNIRVGDFGISCRDREKESRDQTQGTFCYMAPEVVTGQASASSASDVFSFGVVMYEWFFIRDRPGIDFQTDDDHCYENIHDAVHCGREPSIPPWWHPSIRETIRQCLACDPAARPTMSAILLTIRELKMQTAETAVGYHSGIASAVRTSTATVHRPDRYALRRFAVTELNNLMKLRPQSETTSPQEIRAAIEVLMGEYPEVLNILLGLSSHAGPEDLHYEAICSYLRVAEVHCRADRTENETDPESAAADRVAATEMQAAAVNVLAMMPLADLCVPGKRWVPLDLDELHGTFHTDASAHIALVARWQLSRKKKQKDKKRQQPHQEQQRQSLPSTSAESAGDDATGMMLMEEPTVVVPPRLLPVCGLLCSMDDDVRRWTEELLESLPAEQIATPEDVRKELRRALVSGEFDLDEVTGTDLLEMLALRFEEDLITECKQAKLIDAEMINVMSLLISGPASQIIPGQIWLGGVFNATDRRQLTELGITHIVCMAAECSNRFEKQEGEAGEQEGESEAAGASPRDAGLTTLEYWRPAEDLWDEPAADITPYILPALAFIDKARADQQARVLVHCVEGVSRSASVVIALLMRDRKLSFDDALKFVQEKRPKAKPNESFQQQVRALAPVLHQATAARPASPLETGHTTPPKCTTPPARESSD